MFFIFCLIAFLWSNDFKRFLSYILGWTETTAGSLWLVYTGNNCLFFPAVVKQAVSIGYCKQRPVDLWIYSDIITCLL